MLGDILDYKIIIKNISKKDYKNDLIVMENLSQFITYEILYENKEIKSFNYDIKNKKLKWIIGELKNGEEIIINYIVKVTSEKTKDIIESIGFVNNIQSGIIRNTIGMNFSEKKKKLIIKNYEKLKKSIMGKN